MSQPLITIGVVNYNSADFVENTLYCLERITKNNYKIIIRDNNSQLKDYLSLEKKIQKYSNVELYRIENFSHTGSMAHGIGINDLISKMDTKYGVILDADCTFLYKNWDEILINEINEEFPIIGTQAPVGYGSKKEGDFPLMFAILFETEILKKLKINFKPKNPEEFLDTGYELRKKYLEKGYKGKLINFKNTRDFKSGPFRELICAEFYLKGINDIFASHFGRGSTLGVSKYIRNKDKYGNIGRTKIRYSIPIIGKRLLNYKGIKEKKNWIKICKKIVDSFD